MPDPAKHQPITPDDVRDVAKLARLAVDDATIARLTPQLESILGYVDKLREADVTGVEPMAHAVDVKNVFREDVPGDPLPLESTLQNAPDHDGPFFMVPKVIGGEEDSAG